MKRFIEEKKNKEYDICVIGGGVTGAAVAYDAASRGLSVALVEKGDFGAATSSATSKLIHGGLRYLANMEIGLVRESLRERKILENIAPNFVYPMANMVVNSNEHLTSNKWVIKAGMILYDILSFDKTWTWDKTKKIKTHRTYSKKKIVKMEPNVKKEGLTGGTVYYDCASLSPERLTLAFIKSAVKYGADVSNYTKATDFVISNNGDVTGVKVKDLIKNKSREIKAAVTINCGGPWADMILNLSSKKEIDKHIRRSEGIHIITEKLVNKHIVTAMTPEGKHLFVVPWRGYSLIGTTDKEYIGDPDNYSVKKECIEELLHDVNRSFGNNDPIEYKDILFTYGGLRPLVEDQTEDVYESSRKYEIYDNEQDGLNGLITVEGGKYTTSRNLAENVMKTVKNKTGWPLKKCITAKQYLAGCDIKSMDEFIATVQTEKNGLNQNHMDYIARMYGTDYKEILSIGKKDSSLLTPLNDDGEMLAQVIYAVRNEMAMTLKDILFRRTSLGTAGHPGKKELKLIAETVAKELKWSKERLKQEIKEAERALKIP
jgi:glycerol-3-phosphate dehydrogenase